MNNISKVLVCGSISYDTIMSFPDKFKNHIFPDNLELLNLAFHVPELRKEFGGCAANICYNMKMLDCHALPVATVGDDFSEYSRWLQKQAICQDHIRIAEGQCTPQDYITTDQDNNQIAAFHSGAMDLSHQNPIRNFDGVAIGVISPDGLDGMRLHAQEFVDAGVPFLFDSGQATPQFSGEQLMAFIEQANWAIFNSYEWHVFQEKTGYSHNDLAGKLSAHIVTDGGNGSWLYQKNQKTHIPAASTQVHRDPTGCGDAYRAGLIFGLIHKLDWQTSCQVASITGVYSYESQGSQNHHFTPTELYERYSQNYGPNKDLEAALIA